MPRDVCHAHGLRHYYATRAMANGGDVVAVAAVLGQDPTITLGTYASPVDEAKVAASAAVGRTLTR